MDREELATILRKLQTDLGESDTTFANRLGIARPSWTLIRSGRRNLGHRSILGAFRAFPELYRRNQKVRKERVI